MGEIRSSIAASHPSARGTWLDRNLAGLEREGRVWTGDDGAQYGGDGKEGTGEVEREQEADEGLDGEQAKAIAICCIEREKGH